MCSFLDTPNVDEPVRRDPAIWYKMTRALYQEKVREWVIYATGEIKWGFNTTVGSPEDGITDEIQI